MDTETIQKLKDCESLLEKLDASASTAVVTEVQNILSKNVDIIAGSRNGMATNWDVDGCHLASTIKAFLFILHV